MNAYSCPKGHNSIESDYCSECGAKIPGGATASNGLAKAAPDSSGAAGAEHCPACGAAREIPGLAFCEVCGWDFANGPAAGAAMAPVLGVDGALAAAPAAVADATPAASSDSAPDAAPVAVAETVAAAVPGWTVTVEVDLLLRQQASPFPPAGMVPLTLPLSHPVSLIGRRSEARAIFPEISLAYDDAVSHRHALLQLDDAGRLLLRDIGSSNGTRLNGQEITPMQDYPVRDGDHITLGHWTRITVKAIA